MNASAKWRSALVQQTVISLVFRKDECCEASHRLAVEYLHSVWASAGLPLPRPRWRRGISPREEEEGAKALSRRAAIFVRALERSGELDEARDVVHRQELVHVRQHRAHARRPRLESLVTQERVQPDELPARLVQARHLLPQSLADVAVEAVGDHRHDRILSEHSARPSHVEFPKAIADAP